VLREVGVGRKAEGAGETEHCDEIHEEIRRDAEASRDQEEYCGVINCKYSRLWRMGWPLAQKVLQLDVEFFALVGIGFLAQLVDGALGMAFGLISTTALLSLGIPPAQASAAVHTAEVVTTGASGLAHLYQQNINRRLFVTLGAAGVLGGVLGAYVLSNIEGRSMRPFVSAYLLVIGILILMKAVKLAPTNEDARAAYAPPLGLIGGFLDAVGGGGWGPLVT
jgi:uncharacterized membrane protein YfcA